MDEIKDSIPQSLTDGIFGQINCRKFLKEKGHDLFQADWISRSPDGSYYLWEVKHQEKFDGPPFDGHGLPSIQFYARLKFYKETGIRPLLYVVEKPTLDIYIQFFDILETSGFYVTGKSRRIIFPISAFKKYQL
jgi:hypothetical protein